MNDRDERRNETHNDTHHADPKHAAVDPAAAAKQEQVKADHAALEESARRVESSVSSAVRDTPIRPADTTTGDAEDARRNADIARESARRVEASVDHPVDPPSGRR
jgi:hypothetical protein